MGETVKGLLVSRWKSEADLLFAMHSPHFSLHLFFGVPASTTFDDVNKFTFDQLADLMMAGQRLSLLEVAVLKGFSSAVVTLVMAGATVTSGVKNIIIENRARDLGESAITALTSAGLDFDPLKYPLVSALGLSGNINMLRVLLMSGVNLGQLAGICLPEGESAHDLFYDVAIAGRSQVLDVLRQAGVDINAVDKLGGSELYSEAIKGGGKVLDVLCGAGVDINAVDKGGRSALYRACAAGRLEAAQLLIKAGARLPEGESAYGLFVNKSLAGNARAIEVSCKAGVDINALSDRGMTALFFVYHVCVDIPNSEPIRLLVSAGASSRRLKMMDLFKFAVKLNDHELIDVLVKAGFDPNSVDEDGNTLAARFAERGDKEAVRALVTCGDALFSAYCWPEDRADPVVDRDATSVDLMHDSRPPLFLS